MGVAGCLIPVSFALAVFAPGPLQRWTRPGVTPRWGIAAWLAVLASVVGSWVFSAVFLAGDLVSGWRDPGRLVMSCIAALRQVAAGGAGPLAQGGLLAVTVAGLAATATLGWRWVRSILRARAQTHVYARQARIVGRPAPGLDIAVVVMNTPARAAYCVAGRPDTIVVTSAALAALDEPQLRAALAHERAHLEGHHHQLIALTAGLAAALPRLRLFSLGAAGVARLLEMCADDTAVRVHGAPNLLGAVLTLATPTAASPAHSVSAPPAPLPRTALAAAGVDVLARAQRLADPASAVVRWRTRALLGLTILVAVAWPVFAGGFAAATGLSVCGAMPMGWMT